MGLFDGLDVAAAEDLTGNVPGVYRGRVVKDEIVVGSKADPDYRALMITYELEGAPYPQEERLFLPQIDGVVSPPEAFPDEPKDDKGRSPRDRAALSLSFLKKRLASLGVPDESMNGLEEGDLVGIECVVRIQPQRKNPQYMEVGWVGSEDEADDLGMLPESSGSSLSPAAASAISQPAQAVTGEAAKANPFA